MSIRFNGVNSQIGLPVAVSVGVNAVYTIGGWFRYTAGVGERWGYTERSGLGTKVGFKQDNGGVNGAVRFTHRGDGGLSAGVTSIAAVWGDGAWHRFRWHRHGAANFELFLDNVSQGASAVDPGVTTITGIALGTDNGVTWYDGYFERWFMADADLSSGEAEGILWGMHPSHNRLGIYLLQQSLAGNPQIDLSGNGFHSTVVANLATASGAPTGAPFAGMVDYIPERYISNYVLQMRRAPREQPDTPPVLWPPPDLPSFQFATLYGPWERKMELGVRGNWHSFLRK